MAETRDQFPDPETEFFASKQETGHEWELFKENIRPLKRGRNISLLNHALKSHSDHQSRKTLVEKRRKLIEEIDEYDGGVSSGMGVLGAVGDLRAVREKWFILLKAEHCVVAEVIYEFLEVNDIGRTHGLYYIDYALHMECKGKVKTANEIFNLGISRNAKTVEKLNDAYKKFMVRTIRRSKSVDDEPKENDLPSRSFGTVLSRGDNNSDSSKAPLAVYKDTTSGDQTESDKSKPEFENNALPGKWASFKVPQKPIVRPAAASASSFEVFVDEEENCTNQGVEKKRSETISSSSNILPLNDGREIKK
ncbi:unnamed protein product [Brassica oleracea]